MKDFILNPPPLMLVILWLSLAYIVGKITLKIKIVKKLLTAYIMARTNNLPVKFSNILGMSLRRTDPVTILLALIQSNHAQLGLTIIELEAHALAGGDPIIVVVAMTLAKKHNMKLDFNEAATIQLSGKNVLEEVQKALDIKPKSTQEALKEKIK
ncbi:MAG: flotillin-like FloA family protein [Planctomycetota bacterium]|jgi:uncharacterized protein YqfA (UPF0365 family)